MDGTVQQSAPHTPGVQRVTSRDDANTTTNNARRHDATLISQGGTADEDVLVESLNPPESTVSYMSLPNKVHLSFSICIPSPRRLGMG